MDRTVGDHTMSILKTPSGSAVAATLLLALLLGLRYDKKHVSAFSPVVPPLSSTSITGGQLLHFTPCSPRHLKSDSGDHYQAERFKNRAELTQGILSEQEEEVQLLKKKIAILEDVAKRLRKESKAELDLHVQQQDEKNLAEIMNLQEKLNDTKKLLKEQAELHSKVVEELRNSMKLTMEEKDASLERNVRDKKRLEKQVKALQNEILDMDISFEAAQDELKKLQQRLANREDKIQSLESARERSSSAVEQRLKKVEAELVLARLNATKAETLRLESVEIASSSVRAVESRERKLLEEVDSLKRQVERLEEEKRGIEYLHSVPANNDLLDQIKKLQKLLEEERGGIALDIRKEFERFDSTLKRERQQHEDELRPLRSRLEVTEGKVTSSTVGGRVQQLWRRIRRR